MLAKFYPLQAQSFQKGRERDARRFFFNNYFILLIQFSSVQSLSPTVCNPVDFSTPGFPVRHQRLELAQTHVNQVGDAILPSHPLMSPSPTDFNLSQHQGLFQ